MNRRKSVRGVAGILLIVGAIAVGLHVRPGIAEGAGASQTVQLSFGERERTACESGNQSFLLEDLADLYVCVAWQGLVGTHSAQLTFLSPDGHVYQTMTLAFVTPEAPTTVATVEVQGRKHEVKRAEGRRRGETLVTATLPVGGTYITQFHLTGRWTVRLSLDGQTLGEDSFVLHSRERR